MIPDKAGRRARNTSVHRTRSESPKVAVWDKIPGKCPVVGIGIPNGNLDSFGKLLRNVPQHSGLSFVAVPSRPSDGPDSMEILRRLTPMRVIEAADGLELSPDTLYIAPPNAFVKVSEGILRLRRRQPDASSVVDPFFCSLAEERGRGAIGILLTDVTSDGILGLRDIKCAAGFTLACASSVFSDGIPGGALAAGYVDYLLAPDEIARELVRLAAHPYLLRPDAETQISEAELEEIHRTLTRVTSADLRSFRPEVVRRRILRRMALRHIVTASEYVRYFRGDSQEPLNLFAELLLQKAGFFQEPATFENFREGLYDALRKQRQPGEGLRVWVPFSSTGEDAYSTAIALLEMMDASGSRGGIQIFGTDLDEHALEIARYGMYPASVVGDLAAPRLARFFTREAYSYRIRREARDLCVFARHHLASDAPLSRMDLIVFRNRLQSLIPPMQERVLRLLHYSLRPGGVLALGESESVEAAPHLFSAMPAKRGLYVRKENGARISAMASGTLSGPIPRTSSRNMPLPGEITPPERVLDRAARAAAEPLRGSPADMSAIRASHHIQALVEEQAYTIEALRVANEEINCSNEELMVTNEELTAAREELQAANQELGTLNQELEDRNRALARTSLELSVLLRNINIPVITVDSKLRIRHFTPQAQKLFSFTPQDVGRPITDLKPKLDIPELELLLNETLANLASHGKVFRSPENERYWVSIRPYRSEDDRIDGAILSAWPLV